MIRGRIDVVDPPAAVEVGALVAGGAGGDALRETIVAAGATHVWCVVPSLTEAAAVAGLANSIVLDPWPGPVASLDFLVRSTERQRAAMPIVLLRAGTILRRGSVERATGRLAGRDGMVVPSRRGGRAAGIRLRLFRRAPLDPGSGVVVSAMLLLWLVREGWLTGGPPTVGAIRGTVADFTRLARAWPSRRTRRGAIARRSRC